MSAGAFNFDNARDKAIRPACESYFGRVHELDDLRPTPALAQIGDHVVVIGHGGYYRRAIVERAGPKLLGVAYVTTTGGHVTRKTVTADQVWKERAWN